ncbi:ATP-binding cassette domain-containing protein [Bacillus sp. A301a_S52]|jgi:teichoic acid transport system ATP-binding protein|uniref:ABC transporter ATP-binding protein n=1 Tax=Salipaludibacillus agaradhaerens TaxID=76935 RepID=UPI000996BE02|nr:ATP-binding cassette domain-containing protein [Salipaludibacillus agaradhaerens]MCR6112298.1 ATP-binding cassette domain-containing protein [Bacillus sp. A301a_S52]
MGKQQKVIIKAEGLGVYFNEGKTEDYKSRMLDMFSKEKDSSREKKFWPIRDLNLEAYQGEILGIIGSNGSGKTTLCKILTGIIRPDEGSLTINGKVSSLFSLGMGFKKELTGRENVYLNGMMLGIERDKITDYIETIKDFSELNEFFERPMKYYSSGMKARLGFSVASHLDPEILILDEALNTGDKQFGRKAADKMKELVKKAKMVIIVTHSLRYAKRNCDRLIWLEKGEIKGIGTPKEMIKAYKETLPPRRQRSTKIELQKITTTVKNETVIKADNMGVSFNISKDEFWALRNISLEVKEGQVVGIIGHNGAGKSTLCKVLTNILTPSEGSIEVQGETTSLLSYGAGFNEQLSGIDNIYLNGMLLGIPKKRIDEKYDEIVEFSELGKHIHKAVKKYSSGMRARLGFSIAAMLKPDVFIIDEALSTGDMAFKQKASEKIQEIMGQSKAVLIVTHSMSVATKMCNRVIWMERGRIIFDGDPEDAVQKYQERIEALRAAKKN